MMIDIASITRQGEADTLAFRTYGGSWVRNSFEKILTHQIVGKANALQLNRDVPYGL